jgi:hypothetical protein
MFSAPTRLPRLKAGVADLPRKRGRYASLWQRRRLPNALRHADGINNE